MKVHIDFERYVGHDAVLYIDGQPVGCGRALSELGDDIDQLQERCDEQTLGHRVIVISGHNHQVAELADMLEANARMVEPCYLVQEPPRGPRKGKGQRKANRQDRWR